MVSQANISVLKKVKNATHRGHFQFPCNPNKELTTSTNVPTTKVSTVIFFQNKMYFLVCMPLWAKIDLLWSRKHKVPWLI